MNLLYLVRGQSKTDLDPLEHLHEEHTCKDLVEAARKVNCDKFDENHMYQNLYCDSFHPIRHLPLRMLEIGFGCGHWKGVNGVSSLTWKGYFKSLKYYAIDYMPLSKATEMTECWNEFQLKHPNVVEKLWVGDQANTTFLAQVVNEFRAIENTSIPAQFDIIIDDGGHFYGQMKASMMHLWPYISDGGMYVIEDLAADYHFSRVVAKWIEKLSFGEGYLDGGAFENFMPAGIKTITCAHQICMFRKQRSLWERLPHGPQGHPFANAPVANIAFSDPLGVAPDRLPNRLLRTRIKV